ncbi:MAG: hypothetical protein V2J07_04725, partial [Anaerolineae bacterium]|nr:hypothetical protein [Anaerolineae bacterium]
RDNKGIQRGLTINEFSRKMQDDLMLFPEIASRKMLIGPLGGGVQLSYMNIAPFLIRHALTSSPYEAIERLKAVFSMTSVNSSEFTLVSGYKLTEAIEFSKDIRILPENCLPPYAIQSPKIDIQGNPISQINLTPFQESFFIEQKINVQKIIFENGEEYSHPSRAIHQKTQNVIYSLTVASDIGFYKYYSYTRFHNQDLNELKFGQSYSLNKKEYIPPMMPKGGSVDIELAKEIFVLLENLNDDFYNEIETVIELLIKARNLQNQKQQALELSIILEFLLQGDKTGEIAHSVSTRTAWLICQEIFGREEIYRTIKTLYDARSKFVHGNRQKLKPKHEVAIRKSFELIRQLILNFIHFGKSLDESELTKIELGFPVNEILGE